MRKKKKIQNDNQLNLSFPLQIKEEPIRPKILKPNFDNEKKESSIDIYYHGAFLFDSTNRPKSPYYFGLIKWPDIEIKGCRIHGIRNCSECLNQTKPNQRQ